MPKKPGLSDELRAYLSEIGRRGAVARAKALPEGRRREIARKAIRTRWAKAKKAGKGRKR